MVIFLKTHIYAFAKYALRLYFLINLELVCKQAISILNPDYALEIQGVG